MQCPIPSPHYYFVFCVKAKAIPRTISNNFAQFGFLSFSKCKSKTKLSIARHRANEIVLSSPAALSIRALCFLVTVSRAAHLAAELWVSLARPVPPTFHFLPLEVICQIGFDLCALWLNWGHILPLLRRCILFDLRISGSSTLHDCS